VEVEQEFGDQVTFIGVPSLAPSGDIDDFVTRQGIDGFVNIPDLKQEIWRAFEVTQQRTYVFLNDDGTWERAGYGSLRDDVQDLIAR